MPCARRTFCGFTVVALMMFATGGYAEATETWPPAAPSETTEAGKTGKERLSDKASDDQRVNNCKVPFEDPAR